MKTMISFLTQDETKRLFAALTTERARVLFLTAYRHNRATGAGLVAV